MSVLISTGNGRKEKQGSRTARDVADVILRLAREEKDPIKVKGPKSHGTGRRPLPSVKRHALDSFRLCDNFDKPDVSKEYGGSKKRKRNTDRINEERLASGLACWVVIKGSAL